MSGAENEIESIFLCVFFKDFLPVRVRVSVVGKVCSDAAGIPFIYTRRICKRKYHMHHRTQWPVYRLMQLFCKVTNKGKQGKFKIAILFNKISHEVKQITVHSRLLKKETIRTFHQHWYAGMHIFLKITIE